eukprot:jgi/Botrbrau1/19031/Bobra.0100s0059.1
MKRNSESVDPLQDTSEGAEKHTRVGVNAATMPSTKGTQGSAEPGQVDPDARPRDTASRPYSSWVVSQPPFSRVFKEQLAELEYSLPVTKHVLKPVDGRISIWPLKLESPGILGLYKGPWRNRGPLDGRCRHISKP